MASLLILNIHRKPTNYDGSIDHAYIDKTLIKSTDDYSLSVRNKYNDIARIVQLQPSENGYNKKHRFINPILIRSLVDTNSAI